MPPGHGIFVRRLRAQTPSRAMGALAECLSNVSCRTEAANFKPSPSLTVISMFCVF